MRSLAGRARMLVRRSLEVAAGGYVVLGMISDGDPAYPDIDYGFGTDYETEADPTEFPGTGGIWIHDCAVESDRLLFDDPLPDSGTYSFGGAPSAGAARDIARRIAASALCRTALFGNDPNWGRFVSAAGNSPYVSHPARLVCAVQGVVVFERGEPTAFDRKALAEAMKQDDVTVAIDLADGDARAEVLTSDLGYEYIEINAEYTT